jgi:hypothetical protein
LVRSVKISRVISFAITVLSRTMNMRKWKAIELALQPTD